jgi:hypothetical protein
VKNKTAHFAAALLLAAQTLFAAAPHEDQDMKLVNTKSNFVVVEFKEGKPLFHDRFLEAEMKERGIGIPPARRADFGGKETIPLGDPLFQKAFVEIYVPLSIASPIYQWQR